MNIENSRDLEDIVNAGILPAIEERIMEFENGKATKYTTVFRIGRYCETYHEIFKTGNRVDMGKESDGQV